MYNDPLIPGNMYHIYNRGNNREPIFKEPRNYLFFLGIWKKYIAPVADTYVYSLQPNHFHFLINTKESIDEVQQEKSIKQAFSNCFNSYAKSINKAYGRTGSLFQERFGRKLIDTDNYLTQIIFYIHSNAQKHGITHDFTKYPYSSYSSILSEKTTMLKREEVLEWFGSKEQFIEFHQCNQQLLVAYLNQIEF